MNLTRFPLRLGGRVLLAPMAGVTDWPFRRQAVRFGAPYVVAEMTAGAQLAQAQPDAMRRLARAPGDAPLVIQLAGREETWMARGAQIAQDHGADVIDINMGCPARQVTNGYSGSALMREPDHALRLIEAVVRVARVPVTLKMRLGWDCGALNAPDIARRAEAAGVAMIVVHGRTRQQFYKGAADWRAISATAGAVSIPVIANGDIRNAADARRALALSGAAGVMIGRAAQGRPWLPAAIERALDSDGEIIAPSRRAILESLLDLQEDAHDFYGPKHGVRIARKHIAATIDAELSELSETDRRAARARICQIEDWRDVRAAIVDLFQPFAIAA
ncbi:MAG TPA: tRNA dihydrouridine synthase DusB [Caulobacterales bacterium]|nr:tRNA dihydrouridine synthase DusB [Caulobacterales bacterium]